VSAAPSTGLLAPGGAVAAHLPGYEHRPQQLEMLAAVGAAFDDDATLTVEAGTGTGKSLAYLLPAIAWSLQNRERVIVSTHTINLQEQLILTDLPFLTEQAGLACTTALIKGRGNYLCQRKAAQADAQGTLLVDDEHQRELADVLVWARTSPDGSLSDLAVRPHPAVWEQVVSENDNCLRARCPYYATCFFYTARRAAAKADVVVANHHLLMADLALRDQTSRYDDSGVLPPARRVIIDEAHHLEDVATNYFGTQVTFAALQRTFGRLRSLRHEHRGVLPALVRALGQVADADRVVAEPALQLITERLVPRRLSLLAEAEQCFGELQAELESVLGSQAASGGDQKVRVVPALCATPYWDTLDSWLSGLGPRLDDFAREVESVCARIEQLSEDVDKQIVFLNTELRALQGRIAAFGQAMSAFVRDEPNTCRWIEVRRRARGDATLALHTAPIDVGPLLRRALFEPFSTVVLTSATLTVDRRFDYLHRRLGLDGLTEADRVRTVRVESPFDFATQALLAIPQDLPDPNDGRYEAAAQEAILEAVSASGGGAFVLCTAYGMLNRAAAALEPELQRRGLTVLRQGATNRHLLLQRFIREPGAVLFATDSFWEGVDVRGDALRCVIITRLPFRVPTEPIEQARVEAITERGGNAFAEQTVPQAVIKLKQGFGRLIRARTDRGAVVLLDSRVVNKPYGRIFLQSLPPARQLIAPRQSVSAELRRFFGNRRDD
jgi:ATP-dependent DNA helicase DinG